MMRYLLVLFILYSCVTTPEPEPVKPLVCPATQYLGFDGPLTNKELKHVSNARDNCRRIFGPSYVCLTRFIKYYENAYSMVCDTLE